MDLAIALRRDSLMRDAARCRFSGRGFTDAERRPPPEIGSLAFGLLIAFLGRLETWVQTHEVDGI